MIDKFKNYFTYNKKERNGILLLSFVLFLLIFFYQFTYLFVPNTKTDFSEFENLLSKLEYEKDVVSSLVKDSLFYFNPNTLNDNGWISLENLNIKKLKGQSRIDSIYISQRNINSLTFDELRIHPYINYKEAKFIVNFRKQHGDFQSIKDIQKIKLITPEIFRKIAPYFKTND